MMAVQPFALIVQLDVRPEWDITSDFIANDIALLVYILSMNYILFAIFLFHKRLE
jgi:hypothetical protein